MAPQHSKASVVQWKILGEGESKKVSIDIGHCFCCYQTSAVIGQHLPLGTALWCTRCYRAPWGWEAVAVLYLFCFLSSLGRFLVGGKMRKGGEKTAKGDLKSVTISPTTEGQTQLQALLLSEGALLGPTPTQFSSQWRIRQHFISHLLEMLLKKKINNNSSKRNQKQIWALLAPFQLTENEQNTIEDNHVWLLFCRDKNSCLITSCSETHCKKKKVLTSNATLIH